jgi:hypothetical protein
MLCSAKMLVVFNSKSVSSSRVACVVQHFNLKGKVPKLNIVGQTKMQQCIPCMLCHSVVSTARTLFCSAFFNECPYACLTISGNFQTAMPRLNGMIISQLLPAEAEAPLHVLDQ